MDSNELIAPISKIHMEPMDVINGYEVRPGMYEVNGATAIPCGVNFTVYSYGATSCELLLFQRMEKEPFAVLKFPETYTPFCRSAGLTSPEGFPQVKWRRGRESDDNA